MALEVCFNQPVNSNTYSHFTGDPINLGAILSITG